VFACCGVEFLGGLPSPTQARLAQLAHQTHEKNRSVLASAVEDEEPHRSACRPAQEAAGTVSYERARGRGPAGLDEAGRTEELCAEAVAESGEVGVESGAVSCGSGHY